MWEELPVAMDELPPPGHQARAILGRGGGDDHPAPRDSRQQVVCDCRASPRKNRQRDQELLEHPPQEAIAPDGHRSGHAQGGSRGAHWNGDHGALPLGSSPRHPLLQARELPLLLQPHLLLLHLLGEFLVTHGTVGDRAPGGRGAPRPRLHPPRPAAAAIARPERRARAPPAFVDDASARSREFLAILTAPELGSGLAAPIPVAAPAIPPQSRVPDLDAVVSGGIREPAQLHHYSVRPGSIRG
ncbi:uncharacterized protein LOC112346190 [Selaginella moellendorffii]|uniref:uncharacterized protein LOC112346190 n=1 Tax=Selaginella moellendorffii TaxID=88036 RepID=UPI000D1C7944|nr:uncharacterized protein LOC112346190 [Selaginella moellendorffii]|eukprot:XP_024530294.1 uncharacterized protein LOC112346190 [Selaginella moellendorffii]